MKALVWSAVLNALVAVRIIVLLMQISTNSTVMGRFTISRRSKIVGWIATLVMGIASAGFVVSLIIG